MWIETLHNEMTRVHGRVTDITMKITAIETLRVKEFVNILCGRVHADAGLAGLGETFYGAGAVEARIHDTQAARLIGKNPLHIKALHRRL
jgi:galactonate dehydratase